MLIIVFSSFYSTHLKKKISFNFSSRNLSLSSKGFTQKSVLSIQTQINSAIKKRISLKKKKTFFRFDRVVCKRARWTYNSKIFRNNLNLRNRIHQYYDGVLSNSFFKRELKNKFLFLDHIRHSFIKPEFRLDIILWRLNFFSSPYSARIAILNKAVCVNGIAVWFSYYLKQGDIIVVKRSNNLKFVRNLKIMKFSLSPFVEIDYYSNTFIMLQDYETMSVDTFPCVIRQPFKISSYSSYLRLK